MKFRYVVWSAIILTFASLSAAQEACSLAVQEAFDVISDVCGTTGRNQACYGNDLIEAELVPDFTGSFSSEGELIDLTDLLGLRLSAFSEGQNTWGIAYMQVQANLPDSLPGQNAAILVYGDVRLLADEPLENDSEAVYAPMQAFYFRSNPVSEQCSEAPKSGILIQTPTGNPVTLVINGAELNIASTIFVQTLTDFLQIAVLEGVVDVSTNEGSVIVPAGAQTRIPLDDDGLVIERPLPAEPLDFPTLEKHPVHHLPEEIELPELLTQDEISLLIHEILTERFAGTLFGLWQAIDVDGSFMTLEIRESDENTVSAIWLDDSVQVCTVENSAATITGTGTINDDGSMTIDFSVACENGEPTLSALTLTFTYDADSDTLNDDFVTWNR